ncbi:peptide-methionine (S)-S-oxide reductase MsrA [Sneathiella chinensis]|uniref:Peptide methionine sulfoxide reductase MsrA n=1 Tax=Sneathiella chinensis TaxID=349750 RepID=A0ABQ5U1S3_9PROT|nr:peptide-methionine (S)-S-oxide reductase MsrA [Sneathiella chinensis]GLQ05292.1 peptide-methionine (S)-S-oxide reductase [Sneathiella chinensis]
MAEKSETAYFAAGCFWGVEAGFRALPGVVSTGVGYMGGDVPFPDYDAVCSGLTGHAETVAVDFNPALISYSDLLDHFWASHNPTRKNRQGPDVGPQYRSALFPMNDRQMAEAQASLALQRSRLWFWQRIFTEISPAGDFYPAEEWHQQYLEKRGRGIPVQG